MKAFAHLLERLAFTAARNAKLRLLRHYLEATSDPDRGYALAALTGDLKLRAVTPGLLRGLMAGRVDEQLFAMSYDFVGDLAETIALLWDTDQDQDVPCATRWTFVGDRARGPACGDHRDAGPAWPVAAAGVSEAGDRQHARGPVRAHGPHRPGRDGHPRGQGHRGDLARPDAPYQPLFDWIAGGTRPEHAALAPFRPVMLSTPVDLDQLRAFDPADYIAEWKWDGIRVQAINDGGTRRLYSRTGEDVGAAFPDLLEALNFDGAVDGELLVRRGADVAPFGDLQKRLGRKVAGRAMLDSHPAGLRVYDAMIWQGRDLRDLPHQERRSILEAADFGSDRIDLSPLLPFQTWDDLAALRADPPSIVIEGVMIKRRDSAYVGGRPRGPWFKWKRDPMVVDAVMLYAQRGHGKRSGFYSDFTFGLWDGEVLVPVGKAYFGFTDEELRELDRFVRNNTTERFGPVRSVAPKLVLEVAFEGLNASPRHKSGVAMRFPRISRIRWDKPAAEADRLETLKDMIP